MDTDERFRHLASDPRFKTVRKKQHKVEIDDRFQSMFTDEKFTLRYRKDKRGRKHKKTSGDDLKRFYSLEKERKVHEDDEQLVDESEPKKVDEDHEQFVDKSGLKEVPEELYEGISEEKLIDVEDSGTSVEDEDSDLEDVSDEELEDETDSDLSSSSDESESGEDDIHDGMLDIDNNKIQYDWQPLDHDAVKTETATRRLAIQNLDWNHLDVKDVYTLVNSVRPPRGVRIYISEFGKERLAKEELEGPQELAEMPQIDEEEEELRLLQDRMNALENKNEKINTFKVNEYEDADEIFDIKNEEIRERIRRYQLSRMKYYYAIVDFDSAESAEAVYKELDGIEYGGSSLELDLRFVPDDMEFDSQDVKAECFQAPDLTSYKAPQFISSALQQTTVKLTWDETDLKRQEKLQRAYTKEELDKDDLDAYLASDTEDEDDDDDSPMANGASDKGVRSDSDKYRQLLKSLDEEAEKKKKVDVDVVWGDYEADEKRTEMLTKKEKKTAKNKTKSIKKDASQSDAEDADLDLLVMDARKQEEFQFNPDDDRFGAVYESGLYNIDPSHPNFKRTRAFDMMAGKKREKRQRTRT